MRDRKLKTVVAVLLSSLYLITSVSQAEGWFTLAEYRDLRKDNVATAELTLRAMREIVYYAQHSIDRPVICASPVPIAGKRLVEMFDAEIENPTNMRGRSYSADDHVAFILMHALKKQNVCE